MELWKRFVAWFVSGIGAALGVACVIWTHITLTALRHEETPPDEWLPKDAIELSEVRPIRMTRRLTVDGVVTNRATRPAEVNAELEVLNKDGRVMYNCRGSIRPNAAPSASTRFQFGCDGVSTENVPPDVTYRLNVVSVQVFVPRRVYVR